ncbi:MAG TPA: hypothetical protein VHF87_15720 [Methylomirabilota bacterium]|nr:hypothetical protein [Methylomirabilota bacterium]
MLRLDRERFKTLVREQPSSFLAIARVLSRRLASANRTRLVEEQALAARVESSLERLTPWLHLDLASVALLGLLAATIAGSFDGPALQALDWGMLLFFGAVLSLARLATSLGVDTLAGALIQQLQGDRRPGPLGLVLAVAVVSLVIRLAEP